MKLDCMLEEIPVTSTDTKPQKYIITITGTGEIDECNHVMDLLLKNKPIEEVEALDICTHCGEPLMCGQDGLPFCFGCGSKGTPDSGGTI